MTPEEWRMTPNKVGRTVYMPKLSYHGYREVTIQSVFKDTAIVKWQEIKIRLNRLSGQLNFCKKKSAPVSAPAIRKESPFKANCYIHYTKERKES